MAEARGYVLRNDHHGKGPDPDRGQNGGIPGFLHWLKIVPRATMPAESREAGSRGGRVHDENGGGPGVRLPRPPSPKRKNGPRRFLRNEPSRLTVARSGRYDEHLTK